VTVADFAWREYGPDATAIGIQRWLNAHQAAFDEIFADFNVIAVRIFEEMTEPHSTIEHAMTAPIARSRFVLSDGTISNGQRGAADLPEFGLGKAEIAAIRAACVLDDRPAFAETYILEISRCGVASAIVRFWDLAQFDAGTFAECLEQLFTWSTRGPRYCIDKIELRLWNPYVHELLSGRFESDRLALLEHPRRILEQRDVLRHREGRYRALFQMRREPSYVALTPASFLVGYVDAHPGLAAIVSHPEVELRR
jgi:hypothetical protein